MPTTISVLLIREHAEQLTGSGCCGKLEGDSSLTGGEAVFGHSRRQARDLGVLHRALRRFFPADERGERVSIVIVDPRNQLYLAAKLWRDVLRHRPPWREALRSLFQTFSVPAVVVNGRVVSTRQGLPDPDALCHLVAQSLAGSSAGEVDCLVSESLP